MEEPSCEPDWLLLSIGRAASVRYRIAPEGEARVRRAQTSLFRPLREPARSEGNSTISMEDLAVALLDEAERPKHHRIRFTAAY